VLAVCDTFFTPLRDNNLVSTGIDVQAASREKPPPDFGRTIHRFDSAGASAVETPNSGRMPAEALR
jgi:hypothetical protein